MPFGGPEGPVPQAVFVLASASGDLLPAAVVELDATTRKLLVYDVLGEGCPSPAVIPSENTGGMA